MLTIVNSTKKNFKKIRKGEYNELTEIITTNLIRKTPCGFWLFDYIKLRLGDEWVEKSLIKSITNIKRFLIKNVFKRLKTDRPLFIMLVNFTVQKRENANYDFRV